MGGSLFYNLFLSIYIFVALIDQKTKAIESRPFLEPVLKIRERSVTRGQLPKRRSRLPIPQSTRFTTRIDKKAKHSVVSNAAVEYLRATTEGARLFDSIPTFDLLVIASDMKLSNY